MYERGTSHQFYPSPRRPLRRARSHWWIRALLGALLLALTAAPGSAVPAPTSPLSASITPAGPSQPLEGALDVDVTVGVTEPKEYVEVRLQLLRPSGRLVYQKTEVRHDLAPGAHIISFGRDFEGLGMTAGRYPVKVRVRASGTSPTDIEDRVFVYDPARTAAACVPVLRFTWSPALDPSGSFTIDPKGLRPKREADKLLAALGRDMSLRATVAMPPLMLDEWRRAAGGYRFAGPEGVTEVPESDEVPQAYAATLRRLREAVQADSLEALAVPYAEPDISGLGAIDAMADLDEHYARGYSVMQPVLGGDPAPGTLLLSDSLPARAADVLEARDIDFAVLPPSSLTSTEETEAPGPYRIVGSRIRALVPSPAMSQALRSSSATEFVDALFEYYISDEGTAPVAAVVDIGYGGASAEDVAAALSAVADQPWARLTVASLAASRQTRGSVTLPASTRPPDAPAGYWQDVREARENARALLRAVGEADPEADAALLAMLVSESRSWAGPDGGWGLAERGRSYASASLRQSRSYLEAFRLSCEDVTLPGERGEIPVQIRNDSGKTMTLTVEAQAQGVRFPEGKRVEVRLRPRDNFLTLPVDLGASLSGRVRVVLRAGDLPLADSSLTVRASYLERLFVVGTVVLVLVAMLLGIRHKVRSAEPYNVD